MDVERFLPRGWLGLVSLVGAFAFLGAALTYFAMERSDEPPGASSVDVGFLQDMISHHEQALALSTSELLNGEASEVQLFAREILQQQSYEIGMMDRQLADWGFSRQNRPEVAMAWMAMEFAPDEMPGMADPDELAALRNADGEDADALFLALMADHHRGGVDMAKAAAEAATDPWVRDLAERMARNQAIEINEMDAARQRVGLDANPAGYTPGPFHEMDPDPESESGSHDGDHGD